MTALIYAGIPETNRAMFINTVKVNIKNVDYSRQASSIAQQIEKYFGERYQTYLVCEKRSRLKEIALCRQLFFYLFKKYTGLSNLKVSNYYGFNHATLMHSKEKIEGMIEYEKDFKRKYDLIIEALNKY